MDKIAGTIPQFRIRRVPDNAQPYAWYNCIGNTLAGAPNKNTDVCTNVPINDDGNDTVVGAGASPAPTTVGNIVGAYKSLAANGCLDIYKSKTKRWVNCGNAIIMNISSGMKNPIKHFKLHHQQSCKMGGG